MAVARRPARFGAVGLQCRGDVRARLRGRARLGAGHRMVPQGHHRQPARGQAQPRPAAARRQGRATRRQGSRRSAALGGAPGHGGIDVHAGRHPRTRRCRAQGCRGRAGLVRDHRRIRAPDQSRRRDGAGQDGEPTQPDPPAHSDAGRTRAGAAAGTNRVQAHRRGAVAAQAGACRTGAGRARGSGTRSRSAAQRH